MLLLKKKTCMQRKRACSAQCMDCMQRKRWRRMHATRSACSAQCAAPRLAAGCFVAARDESRNELGLPPHPTFSVFINLATVAHVFLAVGFDPRAQDESRPEHGPDARPRPRLRPGRATTSRLGRPRSLQLWVAVSWLSWAKLKAD